GRCCSGNRLRLLDAFGSYGLWLVAALVTKIGRLDMRALRGNERRHERVALITETAPPALRCVNSDVECVAGAENHVLELAGVVSLGIDVDLISARRHVEHRDGAGN